MRPAAELRAAPGDDRHLDAGLHDALDAVAVAHVEGLELPPLGVVVQAAVGEYAVHVQDQQAHARPRSASGASVSSGSHGTAPLT